MCQSQNCRHRPVPVCPAARLAGRPRCWRAVRWPCGAAPAHAPAGPAFRNRCRDRRATHGCVAAGPHLSELRSAVAGVPSVAGVGEGLSALLGVLVLLPVHGVVSATARSINKGGSNGIRRRSMPPGNVLGRLSGDAQSFGSDHHGHGGSGGWGPPSHSHAPSAAISCASSCGGAAVAC